MDRDYQWPESPFKLTFIEHGEFSTSIAHIEQYFTKLLSARCFLFPSARSALSAVLSFENINRNHLLYAPKWSSHCVWDILARYGNPCASYSNNIDVTLNVNKWGLPFTNECKSFLQINDSVDSIFIKNDDLFHGSNYELISLPKTIGSFSGGLLVVKDATISDYIDNLRENSSVALSKSQQQLKVNMLTGHESVCSWEEFDWKNYTLQQLALSNIAYCMKNYARAQEIIKVRLKQVKNKIDLNYLNLSSSRLPCLLPIKQSPKIENSQKVIMKRMFNLSQKNEHSTFDSVNLLPLHIGISDQEFSEFINLFSSDNLK
ncbi:MAG: putative PLP-dependent aminotransferase [Alteromonadales bacterium]|nr:putative PLP-dependent aminotransferase [Alteromonadales bacterium]MCP4986869.1 putative PLP-dependent aminotransferase [Colwellia sp.]